MTAVKGAEGKISNCKGGPARVPPEVPPAARLRRKDVRAYIVVYSRLARGASSTDVESAGTKRRAG